MTAERVRAEEKYFTVNGYLFSLSPVLNRLSTEDLPPKITNATAITPMDIIIVVKPITTICGAISISTSAIAAKNKMTMYFTNLEIIEY
jgi:hypothetical protein